MKNAALNKMEWILFIDVDEFVYPLDPGQMSLLPLLKEYETNPDVAGLQFRMIWFGNSGFRDVPEGLVIENYTQRAAEVVPEGRQKCCVKPDRVELLFIHDLKKCVGNSGKISVSPEQYRLNHYYATSRMRCRSADSRFNEEDDNGMARFVDQVKQNLKVVSSDG